MVLTPRVMSNSPGRGMIPREIDSAQYDSPGRLTHRGMIPWEMTCRGIIPQVQYISSQILTIDTPGGD